MLALVSDTPGHAAAAAAAADITLLYVASCRAEFRTKKEKQRKPSQPPQRCIILRLPPFVWIRTGAGWLGSERRQQLKTCSPHEASSEAANAHRGTGRTANESERNEGET